MMVIYPMFFLFTSIFFFTKCFVISRRGASWWCFDAQLNEQANDTGYRLHIIEHESEKLFIFDDT
jgi:hypothetical protein